MILEICPLIYYQEYNRGGGAGNIYIYKQHVNTEATDISFVLTSDCILKLRRIETT